MPNSRDDITNSVELNAEKEWILHGDTMIGSMTEEYLSNEYIPVPNCEI